MEGLIEMTPGRIHDARREAHVREPRDEQMRWMDDIPEFEQGEVGGCDESE